MSQTRGVSSPADSLQTAAFSNALLEAIRKGHELFLTSEDPAPVFEFLLASLVSLTGSEYGFLDEVLTDQNGDRYKLSLALTDVSWDDESRRVYRELVSRNLEFRNLDNLAGVPVITGEVTVSNDPADDPRSGGTPTGHPPLRAYLGMPLRFGGELVGVAGIANRSGGYRVQMATALSPILSTAASMIHARRRRELDKARMSELEAAIQATTAVLEASPESSFLIDSERRIITGNRVFAGRLGRTLEELVGTDVLDLLPPDTAELRRNWIEEVLTNRVPLQRTDTKNGRIFDHRLVPILAADGTVDRIAIFGADVTERRLAEETLRKSEEKYRLLVETTREGVWAMDRNRRTIYVNGRMATLLGYDIEEMIGRNVADFILADELDEHRRQMSEREAGSHSLYERTFLRKDGTRVALLVSASSLQDAHGEFEGSIAFFTDITERNAAIEENLHLEAELQQAMKMEAIGRLAGGIAHDFNNLLTSMIGNLDLALLDLEPVGELTETLTDVVRAAESAAALTKQLLAFSRKQIIEPRVVELNRLITERSEMIRRLIGEDVVLETRLEATTGSVRIDPGQFEQALVNLAVNARDAMPDGGRLGITTSTVSFDDEYHASTPPLGPGSYVVLEVSDTGEGMNAEVKRHLFEPFFTTKPKGIGTGLGLSTIYGVVTQAGGALEVQSSEGVGTTFVIYLPLTVGTAEPDVPSSRRETMPGGRETILVVEDQHPVRSLAVKVLRRLGYEVLEAANGAAAIDIALSRPMPVDLLFTDVIMPGMNGRELADRLLRERSAMRVLFASGYSEETISHHQVIDEGLSFIAKPYTPHSLARKVREVLDR